MHKLLVTGCGRSGTTYIADVLGRLGIRIAHETMGPDGMSNWERAYDTNGFEVVLHQVRDPLPVITSCTTFLESTWGIAFRHEPRIRKADPLILRGMKYWLFWNRHAEAVARMTYRVEAIPIKRIMKLLGRPYGGVFPDVPKDRNTRRVGSPIPR